MENRNYENERPGKRQNGNIGFLCNIISDRFFSFFFISQANYVEFNSYTSSYTRENDESGARGRNETKKPTGAASFYKIEKRSADTHAERKRGRKRKRDYPRVGMKSLDELIKK